MAARLGMLPSERENTEPAEILELYMGMIWRHSRQVELVAIQTWLIRQMMTSDEKLDSILGVFPYYMKDNDG